MDLEPVGKVVLNPKANDGTYSLCCNSCFKQMTIDKVQSGNNSRLPTMFSCIT